MERSLLVLLALSLPLMGDPTVTAGFADHISHGSAMLHFNTSENWYDLRTYYTVDGSSCVGNHGTRFGSDYAGGGGKYRRNTDMHYIITNLQPGATIKACPQVNNGNGNWQGGTEITFTTPAISGPHPAYPEAPKNLKMTTPPDRTGFTVYHITASGGNCSDLYDKLNQAVREQKDHGSVIKVANIESGASCLTNASGGGIYWADDIAADVVTISHSETLLATNTTFRHANHGLTQGQEIVMESKYADLPGAGGRHNNTDSETTCAGAVNGYHYFVDLNGVSDPTNNFGLTCWAPRGQFDHHGKSWMPMTFSNQGYTGDPGGVWYYYLYPRDSLKWIIVESETNPDQFLSWGSRVSMDWKPKMAAISNPYFNYFQFTGTRNVSTPATFSLNGTDGNEPKMWGKIIIQHLDFTHPEDERATKSVNGLSQAPWLLLGASNSDIIIAQNLFDAKDAPFRYTNMIAVDGYNIQIRDNYMPNETVYQNSMFGLNTTKFDHNVARISSGTQNGNGRYSYTQAGNVDVTFSGPWSSGEGFIYATMETPAKLVVKTPPSVTATCSVTCINIVETSPEFINGCDLGGNFPKNGDGKTNVLPIGCVQFTTNSDIFATYTVNTVANYNPPGLDGCQCILFDHGPGPYLFENNFQQGMGNMTHLEDNNDYSTMGDHPVWYRQDISYIRNEVSSLAKWVFGNPYGGSTSSNGLIYRSRSAFEEKGGHYSLFKGNDIHGIPINTATLSAIALTPVCGETVNDFLAESNWFHSLGNVGQIGSSTQGGCMQTAPSNRFAYLNNLMSDIDGFKYWVPFGGKQYGTGWFVQGGTGDDIILENNTMMDNTGFVPAFFWGLFTLPEGLKIKNNILFARSGFYSGDDIMSNKNRASTEAFGSDSTWGYPLGTAFIDLTRNHEVSCNVYLGDVDATTLGGWLAYGGTIPSTPSNTGLLKLGNPNSYGIDAYRFKADSTFQYAACGKTPGINANKLQDDMGIVKGVTWTSAGTGSATINWIAPDTQGCDVDYGSDLISGFTRILASSFNKGPRSVTISGASGSRPKFRINCEVQQPTGTAVIN